VTDAVCPDCGTNPFVGEYGYRRAASREEAERMPEAVCPNRRHDTWRRFWGLPQPRDKMGP